MEASLQIATFTDPQFSENAYVLWAQRDGPCWIVDPGLPPIGAEVCEHVGKHGLRPDALILTHGHLDHIAGVPLILEAFPKLPVYMADEARDALSNPQENLSASFGLSVVVGTIETIDLTPSSRLTLDGSEWVVYDTSGHSPGGRSLYCQQAGMVIVGDALFQGSIGRTDFHHSDHDLFIRNIKQRLLTLPDETRVYSGHGPVTSIGVEKRTNPFVGL